MARPRRSEHTREALLETGIKLLSQQGYHGTGIKQILDEVQVPKGSFYNYFPSKEAFVAEIIDSYSKQLYTEADSFLGASNSSPADKIREMYQFMLESFTQGEKIEGCLIGNIAAELGSSSKLCQQALQAAYSRWQVRLSKLIEDAQQQGEFRKDVSADLLAGFFWSAWEGSLLRVKMDSDIQSGKETLDVMLNHLLKPSYQETI